MQRKTSSWWLLNPADWRQLGILAVYMALLFSMFFIPECRNPLFLFAACFFGFLNTILIHIQMHRGIFASPLLNKIYQLVLSFGSLYPASANTPAHNIVHHAFNDEGMRDWTANEHSRFEWHLLNLIHFPNAVGPRTFGGVTRWKKVKGREEFRRQLNLEMTVAFGLTGAMAIYDFWTTLFFIVIPQFWGARGVLRFNLLQHDGCDKRSRYNHSRNFVGRGYNWIMCNNGFHTIHHNRASLHWTQLDEKHQSDIVPKQHPSLDEPSFVWYIVKTFILRMRKPERPKDLLAREPQQAAVLTTAPGREGWTTAVEDMDLTGLIPSSEQPASGGHHVTG